jgi:hypothetical protein
MAIRHHEDIVTRDALDRGFRRLWRSSALRSYCITPGWSVAEM